MSWDADFDGGWWNYTHNTNGMIAAAYEAVTGQQTDEASGPLGPVIGAAWWRRLDGATGPQGAEYLGQIIEGLRANPERFRAMNPPNGWGDYDSLLKVLGEMQHASVKAEHPESTRCPECGADMLRWHVSG